MLDFDQMEKVCISQGSAVTFPGVVDKFVILCAKYPGFYIPKSLKSVHFGLSYSKYSNVVTFLKHGVDVTY